MRPLSYAGLLRSKHHYSQLAYVQVSVDRIVAKVLPVNVCGLFFFNGSGTKSIFAQLSEVFVPSAL